MQLPPSPTRHHLLQKIAAGGALALLLAAVAYFGVRSSNATPDVVFTSLTGEKIALHALRGKVVMVNFWATSCNICIHEMPQMVATYDQYKDQGLDFVAVAMSYDPPNYVLDYAQSRRLPFTVALDPQAELSNAFGHIRGTPTTFVIGRDGKIIQRFQGEPDFTALHRMLEQALAAPV
jgi:peroxiredoxin